MYANTDRSFAGVDDHGVAPADALGDPLGERLPDGDGKPDGGAVDPLAGGGAPAGVVPEPELAQGLAGRGEPKLGGFGDVALDGEVELHDGLLAVRAVRHHPEGSAGGRGRSGVSR